MMRAPDGERQAWDRSKCFAWDQSNALKRELWSTAKALTPVDTDRIELAVMRRIMDQAKGMKWIRE